MPLCSTPSIQIAICWDITSRCNDYCKFCYRNQAVNELPLKTNMLILDKLIDMHVRKISFVGGEPLLYGGDLFRLIEYGREKSDRQSLNIEFSLTTNCISLFLPSHGFVFDNDIVSNIINYCDWLTLSLDASNPQMQSKMSRNNKHFDRIITVLDYLHLNYTNKIKIKINTVVSKMNFRDVINVPTIISKYSSVKKWKLMLFLASRGEALKNKNDFLLDDIDFELLKGKIIAEEITLLKHLSLIGNI